MLKHQKSYGTFIAQYYYKNHTVKEVMVMYDKSNPFLKSPGEIDFEIVANYGAINRDFEKNRKGFETKNEELEISLMPENNIYHSNRSFEHGRILTSKICKRYSVR